MAKIAVLPLPMGPKNTKPLLFLQNSKNSEVLSIINCPLSLNNPDSIQINADFWGLANKITGKLFEIRYKHSSTLFNNLENNNNLAPKQNIYCKFSAFKQCIKAGEWQGKVNLRYDDNSFFVGILNKGVHFVETFDKFETSGEEERKKTFQPWQYKGTVLQSFTFPPTSPTGNRQGMEKVNPGEDIDKKGPKNEGGDDVSIDTTALYISKQSYCRGPGGNIIGTLMQALLASHRKRPDSSSYWYFYENRNDSIEVQVTEGMYDYRMVGYNLHPLEEAKGIEANYFTVAIRGTEKTGHVSIQAGLRKQGDPTIEYIQEKDDREKEEQIIVQDYNQPTMPDLGTEIDTELDLDLDDDRDDQDLDDIDIDPDADEKERDDDTDFDADRDKDTDKDKDDDVDSDIDLDKDDDWDDDWDKDIDFDKDNEKDEDEDKDDKDEGDWDDGDGDKERDKDQGG
ncbi:protein of unknown function [endosymbiont DhMRE of Dentiscutata heterogama]|nr:protein of unknown function [endosymbiont DhMRE of Dentiscutata heterogama]